MRRRLDGLAAVRLAFAVSVLEIGYALILFSGAGASMAGPYTPWLSTLFLIGGVTMLTLIRYGVTGWRRVAFVSLPAAPLLVAASFSAGPSGRMIRIVFLTLAIALCALLGRGAEVSARRRARDLFELVYCFLSMLTGILMIISPNFVPPGAFAPAEPVLPLIGAAALLGPAGILAAGRLAAVRPWLPACARILTVMVPAILTVILIRNGQWLGGLMNITFGLTLLFRPTRPLARRQPGETLTSDHMLLRVERSAESWTWVVVVVVVVMTFLENTADTQHMIPTAYSVLALVVYAVVTYWILPNTGQRSRRLMVHLMLLVSTIAHLMTGSSPAAQGVALLSVVPPILATRAKGPGWGYGVLIFTAVLLSAETTLRGTLERPGSLAVSGLMVRVFGLLTAGTLVIRSAAEQRRLMERLQTAQEELQAANEELTAQNEELTEAGRELTALAEADPLTGLVNRRRFQEYVEGAVHGAERGALLFLDLDHFKEINDHLGHAVGDRVLQAVARALRGQAGDRDIVSRLGGDEFAILSPGSDRAAAQRLADSVLQRVRRVEGAGGFRVRASVGITLYPEQGRTVEALLVQADMAMYAVKRNGRNGAGFYAAGLEPEGALYWEAEVRKAMAEERLFLVFQPIMTLNTGQVAHCEALLRMTGPDGTVIMPDEFLPHVESLPLMDRIDRWVIQSAITQLAEPGVAESGLVVGVNLSARAFDDPELPGKILTWLADAGVAPRRLVFEVTETLAITDLDRANAFIDTLRRSGCRFAIDDFGSGFASFSYLRHLRVDFVKIDGRMVQDLREGTLPMVQGIVAIAKGLKLGTVAEWVEDGETLDLLRQCGVDLVQGFLIGHPGALSAIVVRA